MAAQNHIPVTCIMLADEEANLRNSIRYFLNQNYPHLELLIISEDPESIADLIFGCQNIRHIAMPAKQAVSTKRNHGCDQAHGEIIIHWDEDDWYATDWVNRQVNALVNSKADISGLNKVNFKSPDSAEEECFFRLNEQPLTWIYSTTLCYWKSFWKAHPFKESCMTEDQDFITNSGGNIYVHSYSEGCLGLFQTDLLKKASVSLKRSPVSIPRKQAILPTISSILLVKNRHEEIRQAIDYFISQDYPNKELVIMDDGNCSLERAIPYHPQVRYFFTSPFGSIESKRNVACRIARGEFITHWGENNWYAHDWLTQQISAIITSNADIAGLEQFCFFSSFINKSWKSKGKKEGLLCEETLIYRKSFWKDNLFKNQDLSGQATFNNNINASIFIHNYYSGFIANLNSVNEGTLLKKT